MTSIAQRLQRSYPELKDRVDRVIRAAERGDRFAAGADAWLLQSDVRAMVGAQYTELGLPDLLEATFEELTHLADQARCFHARMRGLLEQHGVDLCELDSLDALERWLG